MQKVKIGKHVIEYYDDIEELPMSRFHKYQKMLLIDSGIGSDLQAFDRRTERARRFIMQGKKDEAMQEFNNLRQCIYFIQQEFSPKLTAFAALVTGIDGRACNDVTDDALAEVAKLLQDGSVKEIESRLGSVKKKIDTALSVYFPNLFADSETKEYYGLVRQITVEMLGNIIKGDAAPGRGKKIDELETKLITFNKPQRFDGSNGVEVGNDKEFDKICMLLSQELHIKPKDCTVMEFYNAYEFMQDKAKQRETAQNRANKR